MDSLSVEAVEVAARQLWRRVGGSQPVRNLDPVSGHA